MSRLKNDESNAMPLGANESPYTGPAPTDVYDPPTTKPLPQMGVYGYDQNEADQPWDQSQQVVLVAGQGATSMPPEPPTDWRGPAILACLCCIWPVGIVAIIAANKANTAYELGDYEGARKHAASAKMYTITSVVVGIVLLVVVGTYYVVKIKHDIAIVKSDSHFYG